MYDSNLYLYLHILIRPIPGHLLFVRSHDRLDHMFDSIRAGNHMFLISIRSKVHYVCDISEPINAMVAYGRRPQSHFYTNKDMILTFHMYE